MLGLPIFGQLRHIHSLQNKMTIEMRHKDHDNHKKNSPCFKLLMTDREEVVRVRMMMTRRKIMAKMMMMMMTRRKIMMRAPHVWAADARLGGSEPSAAQSSPTLQKL